MSRNPNKGREGSKMGRPEAIQTWVVYIQRYHCLSVCRVGASGKSRLLTLKTNLPTCCQKSSIQSSSIATGALVGLSPPNWNIKHCKSTDFYQIFKCQALCTNVKPPFWRVSGDSSDTINTFSYVVWDLGREVFTKLRFGSPSKKCGRRWFSHFSVSGWSHALYGEDRLQAICNDSVNALSTYKIKSILLLRLDLAADSSRCSWMISNLL